MSVSQMLRSMTASEFAEWYEFYRLDPWGEERADWRAGMIASVLANVNRGKKGRTFKPEDFMPEFGPKETAQQSGAMNPEQSVAYAKHLSNMIQARQKNG